MDPDDIQKLYVRVCEGYDRVSIVGLDCFLKHHSYFDRVILKEKYKEGIRIAKSSGIKTESEYLDFYIDKGWWSTSKEDEIRTATHFIDTMKKSREKLILPSQKDQVSKSILEEQGRLDSILLEKKSIIPMTAEEYADKYYNRFYLHYSLFKDPEFKVFLADSDDYFVEIEDDAYNDVWSKVLGAVNFFKVDSLKYVAAGGFFQNLLVLIGKDMSIMDFYGKPVSNLTINQTDLFSYASGYRRAINNATEQIPDYILSDPINLIDWCEGGNSSVAAARSLMDRTPNKNKTKGERSGRISSIVGASSSDYKKLGIGGVSSGNTDLLSAAEDSGGEMPINQVIKKTDR
jgi:hypothetical protein